MQEKTPNKTNNLPTHTPTPSPPGIFWYIFQICTVDNHCKTSLFAIASKTQKPVFQGEDSSGGWCWCSGSIEISQMVEGMLKRHV